MTGTAMNYHATPQGDATYQDVLDAPEGMVAELINGVLHTQPRPAPKHLLSGGALAADLVGNFRNSRFRPGGWLILSEPEVHFSDKDIFDPDIAGWRYETLPKLPDTAYFETVPDWVCEVLSPSTARIDRHLKLAKYAHYGVGHYWIVDPKLKTLEVFELRDAQWVLIGTASENDVVNYAPFEDVTIELQYLWDGSDE